MKSINWRLNILNIHLLWIVLTISFISCEMKSVSKNENGDIVIENKDFKYTISQTGKNLNFIDKATGTDYLDSSRNTNAFSITAGEKAFEVNSIVLKGKHLQLSFDKEEVFVELLIKDNERGIAFEILKVNGDIESINFLNIPLNLKGMPNDEFAACALSMNLQTRVKQLPALQTHLWASCYQRFGMEGSKITLVGVPEKDILPSIREVMKGNKDIPYSTAGGAWAKESEEGHGSYLFNYGDLTEETVDDWIEMCSNVGFDQIDSHGGHQINNEGECSFFMFGSFELNKENFPDGWDSFKRINAKLHEAGISHIFHTYAFFISKISKYITPVPHEDLAYFSSFTLAEPFGLEDSTLVVNESTENISTITGVLVKNSRILKLGNELIEFEGVTNTPPYKFTGCKRGLHGTRVTPHEVNENAYHLKEMFGLFLPDPDSELFVEIARNHAKIVNENNFDGIYLDAIDGINILDGWENSWYYGAKFITEIVKALDHPVGMEMSAMEHHYWHYRSRFEAWDSPVRGHKRFLDIHLASINKGLLLPLHLGWWENFTFAPPQTEATFSDDIEYLCSKMIGYNAGLSLLGGVEEKEIKENPAFQRLNALIKQYEELRQKDYFVEEIKELLRQPGKEFSLYRISNDEWNFKPVVYEKHKVTGLDHPTATWTVNNELDSQPIKLRIESLMSVKPYNDPFAIILTDFSKPMDFMNERSADGVTGQIIRSKENVITGEPGGLFSAHSTGESQQNGTYLNMEKTFMPLLDLNNNQALGLWIKGDGSGQILNISLRSPVHISFGARGDHIIPIDFVGWKYFELVEIESSKSYYYSWGKFTSVYDYFRNHVDFGVIEKVQLWYNQLPSDKEVRTVIGPLKALPMVSGFIENPTVTIGGETIVFPVKIESGMYLEFLSLDDCKLYGSKGEILAEVKPEGYIPNLIQGNNEISFSGKGSSKVNTRVQVTVISEDDPLDIK